MTRRLFIAIPLSKLYLDKLGDMTIRFNIRGVRWTARQNLHVTVLFLGDVKENKIKKLAAALKDLKKMGPFNLEFKKLSFAPPNHPPRMIWAQFEESAVFDKLAKKCFKACRPFCHLRPPYRQIPHITLARFKHDADWQKINLPYCLNLKPLEVNKIKLLESTLTSQGPIYQEIQEINLV